MAKPTAQHRSLATHKPHIEKVRTHVRAHCKGEALISHLLSTLDLTDKEFSETFKSPPQPTGKEKKRRKKTITGKDSLRIVVGTHLNHLVALSKLADTPR